MRRRPHHAQVTTHAPFLPDDDRTLAAPPHYHPS
jgi:hypothetical protein